MIPLGERKKRCHREAQGSEGRGTSELTVGLVAVQGWSPLEGSPLSTASGLLGMGL